MVFHDERRQWQPFWIARAHFRGAVQLWVNWEPSVSLDTSGMTSANFRGVANSCLCLITSRHRLNSTKPKKCIKADQIDSRECSSEVAVTASASVAKTGIADDDRKYFATIVLQS